MGKPKETTQKDMLGKKVRYIGLGGIKQACHYCGVTKGKGMFVEYKDHLYCHDGCIKAELANEQS